MISEGITLEEAIQIELEDAKEVAREKGMEKGMVHLVDALLTCGQSLEQAFHMAARQYGREIAAVENVYHARKRMSVDATRDAEAVGLNI